MSADGAYEVAKRALRLADERRWRDLVALVDDEALEAHRREVVASEVSRVESRSQPVRSDMPDAVREWYEEKYARHIQMDRLSNRYAGVASLEELRSHDGAELLARELQARREDVRSASAEDAGPDPFAQEIMEVHAERRQPIGIVEEGRLVAHVLYRVGSPAGPEATGLDVLTLRLTERGWRLLLQGEMFVVSGWSIGPQTVWRVRGEDSDAAVEPIEPIEPIEPMPWVERTFPSGLPVRLLPMLLSRFEGSVQRLHGLANSVSHGGRTTRPSTGGWSIQEHVGHLLELERLGEMRLAEFERGADVLSAADMTNRATEEAGYNQRMIQDILPRLIELRFLMIERLRRLSPEQLEHSAMHPRLQQPMNVMDWLFFMCEHDDHHLAHIQRLKEEYVNALLRLAS